MQHLAIGTAQWGLDYGATNAHGRISDSNLDQLIQALLAAGVTELDTAPGYGDSELRIGARGLTDLAVQTKVSAKGRSTREILSYVVQSVQRLGRTQVDSLLVHDWFELTMQEREHTADALGEALASGMTLKVGISAYSAEDIESALSTIPQLKRVQIPLNILDQRFIRVGESYTDIEFQARSIFLQGLLLSPKHMEHNPELEAVAQRAQSMGLSLLDFAMYFISHQDWLHSILIAPTSSHELNEILQSIEQVKGIPETTLDEFASQDLSLIDPRTWNQ